MRRALSWSSTASSFCSPPRARLRCIRVPASSTPRPSMCTGFRSSSAPMSGSRRTTRARWRSGRGSVPLYTSLGPRRSCILSINSLGPALLGKLRGCLACVWWGCCVSPPRRFSSTAVCSSHRCLGSFPMPCLWLGLHVRHREVGWRMSGGLSFA